MSANIQLKIENLSQFAQEEPNFRRLSDAVYLHGLSWKILAYPREIACPSPAGLKCLSYFLQCNASNEGITHFPKNFSNYEPGLGQTCNLH
jgi:hypothetical protein